MYKTLKINYVKYYFRNNFLDISTMIINCVLTCVIYILLLKKALN